MLHEGSIVTLKVDKEHGSQETAYRIKAGICGMVVQVNQSGDGNHRYVVDFGAEGQWNCVHQELEGNDSDIGWDNNEEEEELLPEPPQEEPRVVIAEVKPIPVNPEKDIEDRIRKLKQGKIS